MAKQVIWTNSAKKARNEIRRYWIHRNGSNAYSKKLSQLIRKKSKTNTITALSGETDRY